MVIPSETDTVTIRVAQYGDAPVLVDLLAQLGYPQTLVVVEQMLQRSAADRTQIVFVAEYEQQVVGFAALVKLYYFHRHEDMARLSSLVVNEAHRSHRIGEQLLQAAEQWARQQQCKVLELASNVKRVDAHRFYERLGYNKTGWRLWKAIAE